MTIRPAEDSDIPAIVDLLKLSLGESLMPKSETFWKWKHIENPFGRSPVLLAFEDKALVGVRAFMRWEWRQGDSLYKAVRAVDTATHPAYQGKGIFSKLTLQLVKQCKEESVDFVFNTPNKKSMPGYLKMGWQSAGRLPVAFKPVWSFGKKSELTLLKFQITDELLKSTHEFDQPSATLCTNYNTDYFRWRYAYNPNEKYYALKNQGESRSVVFFRMKKSRFGLELRICDFLPQDKATQFELHKQLMTIAKQSGATYVSMNAPMANQGFIQLPLGPVVTLNFLSDKINSLNFQTWNPSLGDLEMF